MLRIINCYNGGGFRVFVGNGSMCSFLSFLLYFLELTRL
jgi:hypothetical protein